MRPALAAPPAHTSSLFVDHVAHAIATHVAHAYGGLRAPTPWRRGGLAPVQARRARELLRANLSGRILLSDLANACELSVRQFTRAFRKSFHMAPHQWLLERRVDRARDLLVRSRRSLPEIAAECGFADQSHFTRVFTHAVGMTPAAYRQARH